jgi:hypothetical protein
LWRLAIGILAAALAALGLSADRLAAQAPLPVRVVVVANFDGE